MKKILLGCGLIGLLAVSVPVYVVIKYQLERQNQKPDCKAVQPTIDIFVNVTSPFYSKVMEQKETPGLALRTAAKVEAALPKLALIKLKDASLNESHQVVLANWRLFVTDARDWASAYQPGDYLHFISKRTVERPQGFRNNVAGGAPIGFIINYCE